MIITIKVVSYTTSVRVIVDWKKVLFIYTYIIYIYIYIYIYIIIFFFFFLAQGKINQPSQGRKVLALSVTLKFTVYGLNYRLWIFCKESPVVQTFTFTVFLLDSCFCSISYTQEKKPQQSHQVPVITCSVLYCISSFCRDSKILCSADISHPASLLLYAGLKNPSTLQKPQVQPFHVLNVIWHVY